MAATLAAMLGQIGLPSAEGAKPKVEKIAGGIDVERLKEIGG